MLQQTQVKTVIPFFKKFIGRYPNLKSFPANEEEILALWTGWDFIEEQLICTRQKIILSNFKNRFPKSFVGIVGLPELVNQQLEQ